MTDAELTKKATRAIERQTADAKGWRITDLGEMQFIGKFNRATLRATAGMYVITVADGTGRQILGDEYKTLKAALTNGRMYANSNYSNSRPRP